MAQYQVLFDEVVTYYTIIEADSYEEAEALANHLVNDDDFYEAVAHTKSCSGLEVSAIDRIA